MAINPNETYAVPGWVLALLVTAAGGGLVWGGFNLDTAQAAEQDMPYPISAEMSQASVVDFASIIARDVCPDITTDLGLSAGVCTPLKVATLAQSSICVWPMDTPQDSGEVDAEGDPIMLPVDGVPDKYKITMQLDLPASVSVSMP